ncbi:MAG: hypothetical protein WD850_02055 [Candidatus Spechtbacterales bacterium]
MPEQLEVQEALVKGRAREVEASEVAIPGVEPMVNSGAEVLVERQAEAEAEAITVPVQQVRPELLVQELEQKVVPGVPVQQVRPVVM